MNTEEVIVKGFMNTFKRVCVVSTSENLVYVTSKMAFLGRQKGEKHPPAVGYPREDVFFNDPTWSANKTSPLTLKQWHPKKTRVSFSSEP